MEEETRRLRKGAGIASCLHAIAVMDYLCESLPFSAISVGDICKASGLSRSTFYRLFDDKFDAVNWIMFEISQLGHNNTGRTMSWHDASLVTLSGFGLIKNLLRSASEVDGYESLSETSVRLRIANLTEALVQHRKVELDDELAYEVDFFARSEIPAVRRWYMQTVSVPAELMACRVERCVPRRLHDLLALPDDPRKGQPLTWGRMATLLQEGERG